MARPRSKKKEPYQMTLEEVKLLQASVDDPNLLLSYWFKKKGADRPFQFDYNVTDPWQVDFCMAAQTLIVVVAGISTGKTLTVGMTACYHALLNDDFEFLNIGLEQKQAAYMYDAIINFSRGTRFEKLITSKAKSPNPHILIEFKIGDILRRAQFGFVSAGDQSDAMNIFSYRGDMINVEEAGRFPELSKLVSHLTTRLTGSTASGRPYIGRLSLISNPHENPELWQIFDQAAADPQHSLVINVDTSSNKNTTEAQLEAQLRNMTKEEQERFLTGMRPEGRGVFFSKNIVKRNASALLTERLRAGIASGQAGWVLDENPILGIYHFKMPREKGRRYIVVGDPGISNPPLRNSPAIFSIDVTEAPKFAFVNAMWWGFGNGSIQPFVNEFFNFIDVYAPDIAAMDSTSTQKNMAEILNLDYIWGNNKSITGIIGLDFSGPKKVAYLVGARLTLEQDRLQYPDGARGISSQLQRYDLAEDGTGAKTTSKLAQDLVATFSMGTHVIRAEYGVPDDTDHSAVSDDELNDSRSGAGSNREVRSGSRR